jgi:adenylate cyclase
MSNQPDAKIRIDKTIQWLMDGVPTINQPEDILTHLVEHLEEAGLPLCHAAIFVSTLHPNVFGRSFHWKRGSGTSVQSAPIEIVDTEEYRQSPVLAITSKNKILRYQPQAVDCPDDFPILEEFREAGITDYYATPLYFTNGETHCVTWGTDHPGGFNDAQISALNELCAPLARIAEIFALKRVARNLLDTYLGEQSGQQVLDGRIRRGDGEKTLAVIWFCDLRDSTPLSESMPLNEYFKTINEFFEQLAGAVLAHNGEVLRFIGDAVLAIFPIREGNLTYEKKQRKISEAGNNAINAAQQATMGMEKVNGQRSRNNLVELGYGIGLHLGDVMYGNVGTRNRLEFSVIGAAANVAARIEGYCKQLKKNILFSNSVANHIEAEQQSLGHYELKGVKKKLELFTLANPK